MKVLLVGLTGHEDTSKIMLDLISPKHYLDKWYLDCQVRQTEAELDAHFKQKKYDYIIIYAMKDALGEDEAVELVTDAVKDEDRLTTNFLYEQLKECLEAQGIKIAISHQADEEYANEVYYTALKSCSDMEEKGRCIRINLPAATQIDVMKLSQQMSKYFAALVKAR